MADYLTSAKRRRSRLSKKANEALAAWLSPMSHPLDLLEYERYAEAHQIAEYQINGIEASIAGGLVS